MRIAWKILQDLELRSHPRPQDRMLPEIENENINRG